MRVNAIGLENVRGWRKLYFDLPSGVSAFLGVNASGKTTVLEAIWYVASLQSHRTSTDEHLIMQGQAAAIIRASVARTPPGAAETVERVERLEIEIRNTGRARANIGGAPVTRRRDLIGVLRAAIFSPERVAVVRGDPSDRRRFVDEVLIQLAPRYHAVIKDYEKALRQRNALLREIVAGRATSASLDAWDEAISGPGGELAAGRARAVGALQPEAARAYERVGEGEELTLRYVSKIAGMEEMFDPAIWTKSIRVALAERRRDEMMRGTTLVGPHRDDVAVEIGGLPARTHASQGEAWMAALALVLGAHAAIAERIGESPVLLLDDVFNPLDPARRERLSRALPEGAQILITAADPQEVPAGLNAHTIHVSKGMTQ